MPTIIATLEPVECKPILYRADDLMTASAGVTPGVYGRTRTADQVLTEVLDGVRDSLNVADADRGRLVAQWTGAALFSAINIVLP